MNNSQKNLRNAQSQMAKIDPRSDSDIPTLKYIDATWGT